MKNMGNKSSKRIGTFKQFQKEKRQQKINEEKINIEIEWWDECILEVMQDLKDECNGFFDYDTLVKFVKNKERILGEPDLGYPEGMLERHIKSLIFSHHWDSNVFDGMCSWGEDQSQVQALGLAISELAKVILEKVLDTIKTPDDPISGVTSIGVVDKEPRTLVPMTEPEPFIDDDGTVEYYEDLPFEYKYVQGFEKFTKMLEEAKTEFRLANQQEVIDNTLQKIEQEVGSLDLDDIAQVVVDKYGPVPEDKGNVIFDKYIKNIVMSYLNKRGIVQTQLKKKDGLYVSKNVLDGIYNLFAEMAVDEIEHILTSKARKEGEDEEVK